jgi:hypothetical protein
MCRSAADGGRRCPRSRGGHSTQTANTTSQPGTGLPPGFRAVTPPTPVGVPTPPVIPPPHPPPRGAPPPPAKPKRMSEKRYREAYDDAPVTVIRPDGTLYRCCGPVSGHIIARSVPGSRVVEGHHSHHRG